MAAFTAKSLVRFGSPTRILTPYIDNHSISRVLEIEESYDRTRQLGKMVVLDQGVRSELFVRLKDNLYLDARYRQDGSLANCKTWHSRPNEGYFGLFRDITERPNDPEGVGDQRELTGFLIGPVSLAYLFRNELQALWLSKLKKELTKNNTNQLVDDKASLFDRRQVNPTKPIQFSLSANNLSTKVVTFKQSEFLIERSTELSELATYAKYDNLFMIDYLAIDQFDSRSRLDLFKLPSRFSCIDSGAVDNVGLFKFEQVWPSRVPAELGSPMGRSLNVIFHETELYPEGVNFILDSDRQMLRFNIEGHSENLVDFKRAIVYQMPLEPAPNSDSKRDVLDVEGVTSSGLRNADCSILSLKQLLDDDDQTNELEPSIWRFLAGKTNLVAYIGKTMYMNGRPVHEFELSYKILKELPIFFRLLVDVSGWQATDSDLAAMLIGKLWLSLESCSELYSKIECSNYPNMLGYKLELIANKGEEGLKVLKSHQVHVGEFHWEPLKGFSALEAIFDIGKCPINKLDLSLGIRWSVSEETNYSKGNYHQLDDFVYLQLRRCMMEANIELDLVRIDRANLLPGTMMATYSITLAESPNQVNAFELAEVKLVPKNDIKSILVGQSKKIKTLFECLSWASQYGNARTVLFTSTSPATECLILETDDWNSLVESRAEQDAMAPGESQPRIAPTGSYSLYIRRIERTHQTASKVSNLKMFISQQLRELNKILLNTKSTVLKTGDPRLDTTRLQFWPLKVVPDTMNAKTIGSQTTLTYKPGYRFLEVVKPDSVAKNYGLPDKGTESYDIRSRTQVASISFSHCLSRCEVEPHCASFSYCKYTDFADSHYCQLTDLKLDFREKDKEISADSLIGRQLTRDAGCEIHVKDYLQYFQQKSNEIFMNEEGNDWHLDSNAKTLLDCASSCFTSPRRTCLRFSFCQNENARCFHWIIETLQELVEQQIQPASVNENEWKIIKSNHLNSNLEQITSNQTGCLLFKRKPITLYHRTLTTRSGSLRWSGENLVESRLEHVDKDSCADRCLAAAECQSFDSCRILSGTVSLGGLSEVDSPELQTNSSRQKSNRLVYRHDCILLSGSVLDKQMMQLNKLVGEQDVEPIEQADMNKQRSKVLERTQCTHYEHLEAKQSLSPQKLNSILQTLQVNIDKTPATSYAANLFGAALLGLALGLCVRLLASSSRRRRRSNF